MTQNKVQREMQITPDQEEKRLKDFKRIAENWDKIPEYAKGKLDGTISTIALMMQANEKAG